jgi:hypothetical protein
LDKDQLKTNLKEIPEANLLRFRLIELTKSPEQNSSFSMSITGPAPKEFSIYDAFANESILLNKRGTLVSLIDPEQTFTDTTLYVMNTS